MDTIKRIQEFSDDELVEELYNRFDHIIICGRKDGYGGQKRVFTRRFYKGDYETCVALCEYVKQIIIKDVWDRDKEGDDDDPEH